MALGYSKQSISQVKASILEHARSAGLTVGARMPTERELQDLLGVSRSRIRDALAALESDGLVLRLIGDGTYLCAGDGKGRPDMGSLWFGGPEAELTDTISPSELIEARLVLELGVVPFVVRNATRHDFCLIEEVLDQSEKAETEEDFEALDARYHHLIAAAGHNELLTQFSEVITRGRLAASWRGLKKRSYTPRRRNDYQHDHRIIFEALANRDEEAARTALQAHLVHIQIALLGL
ncbi:MAG TPA: FCD domain-containing protein [Burkholderiaceae bacterium]|nr:FCD domain-containing protein [Burkholderiaceae bacterium]